MSPDDVSRKRKIIEGHKFILKDTMKARRRKKWFPRLICYAAATTALSGLLGMLLLAEKRDAAETAHALVTSQTQAYVELNQTNTRLVLSDLDSAEKTKQIVERDGQISELDKIVERMQTDIGKAQKKIQEQQAELKRRGERTGVLDEALVAVNKELEKYKVDLTTSQQDYRLIEKKQGELEIAVEQLRENNAILKKRFEGLSENKKRQIAFEEAFLNVSKEYRLVVSASGKIRTILALGNIKEKLAKLVKTYPYIDTINATVLIDSIDSINQLSMYQNTLQKELSKTRNAQESLKLMSGCTETISNAIRSGLDEKEYKSSIDKIREIWGKTPPKPIEPYLKGIETILQSFYDITVAKKKLQTEHDNLEIRYELLEGADKERERLAQQIVVLNKKVEGLEGQIPGLTSELEKKKAEVDREYELSEAYGRCVLALCAAGKVHESREDVKKKIDTAVAAVDKIKQTYDPADDSVMLESLEALNKMVKDSGVIHSTTRGIIADQAELKEKYTKEQAERKKAVESIEYLERTMSKVLDRRVRGIFSQKEKFDEMLAVLNDAKVEYSKRKDEKGELVVSEISAVLSSLKANHELHQKKTEELTKRLETDRQEYSSVIVNGLARRDQEDGKGPIFLIFDATYYKDKDKKENLIRIGRYINKEMADRLDAFARLTEHAYRGMDSDERRKKMLLEIGAHAKLNGGEFSRMWVRDDSKEGGTPYDYTLVIEYTKGGPMEISVDKNTIVHFVKDVVLDR